MIWYIAIHDLDCIYLHFDLQAKVEGKARGEKAAEKAAEKVGRAVSWQTLQRDLLLQGSRKTRSMGIYTLTKCDQSQLGKLSF